MSGAPGIASLSQTSSAPLRIGFVGVGWIGRHRMKAMIDAGYCQVAGITEPDAARARAAQQFAGNGAEICPYDELLDTDLDGIVIATPNSAHAEQSIAALNRGISVFCQKPLARTYSETERVIEAARAGDRLLCVDLSYRFVEGIRLIRGLVQSGALGKIYAAELTFHNAYGPDKSWFYDPELSGGGCVIDLGIHLVDLALWMLDFPAVTRIDSRLFSRGQLVQCRSRQIEDYATAHFDLKNGTAVEITCSWKVHAGCDAVIDVFFHGTEGGARLRNVNGSFFDFLAERFCGTQREILSCPPEEWGGRAALDWLQKLSISKRFDPEAEQLSRVASVLDLIYSS